MLDKESVREIALKYSDEVRKLVDPISVILFGSYANGSPHAESDIDIAVLVRNYSGDWFDMKVKLHGLKWKENFTDIEPHFLDIDEDPYGFVQHVQQTGEVIYQAGRQHTE
jgi:predicted nucleotidyltransferase